MTMKRRMGSNQVTTATRRHHASATPAANRMVKANAANRLEKLIKNGDVDGVSRVLGSGQHPDTLLRGGRRPLAEAVRQEDPAMFDAVLEHGASLNPSGKATGNGLFACVRQEDVRGMNRMIAAGASAAETEGYVNDPPAQNILYSVGTLAPDVVRRLLDAGAWKSLDITDKHKRTPVQHLRKARAAVVGETGEDYQPDLFDNNRLGVIGLMERYAGLPRLDFAKGDFSKADLFTPDSAGNTPLDHPESWNRWPEVAEVLKKRGEHVTLDDLQKTDASGKTWLTRAVECWSLPQVVDTLNNQGEKLDDNLLLQPNGSHAKAPSPLFEAVREHHQLAAIFTEKNLFGKPRTFRALFSQLSESEQARTVPYPHGFSAVLGNPSTQGIGR